MRGSLTFRTAFAGAMLVAVAATPALVATPAIAARTVASVTLDVPAAHGRAAVSIDVANYTLDANADFSLIRLARNATDAAASRVTVVLPGPTPATSFVTKGWQSRFPTLSVRQSDVAGAAIKTTVFYNVRIVRFESFTSDGGPQRRVTFVADRMKNVRAGP